MICAVVLDEGQVGDEIQASPAFGAGHSEAVALRGFAALEAEAELNRDRSGDRGSVIAVANQD